MATLIGRRRRLCVVLMACMALFGVGGIGCTTARPIGLGGGKASFVPYDSSDKRGVYFVSKEEDTGDFVFCSEPSPDTARNTIASVVAELAKADITIDARLSRTVVKLSERTEMILFLRESLYRLCEQSIMGILTEDSLKEHYDAVIAGAVAVLTNERMIIENQEALIDLFLSIAFPDKEGDALTPKESKAFLENLDQLERLLEAATP